jgi:hypothetical protein
MPFLGTVLHLAGQINDHLFQLADPALELRRLADKASRRAYVHDANSLIRTHQTASLIGKADDRDPAPVPLADLSGDAALAGRRVPAKDDERRRLGASQ